MSLIDSLASVGPIAGLAASILLLHHFTILPFWAVLLISIPVGGIIGIAGGIGLGIALEFVILKLIRKK